MIEFWQTVFQSVILLRKSSLFHYIFQIQQYLSEELLKLSASNYSFDSSSILSYPSFTLNEYKIQFEILTYDQVKKIKRLYHVQEPCNLVSKLFNFCNKFLCYLKKESAGNSAALPQQVSTEHTEFGVSHFPLAGLSLT